jgi:hypothetical protein
MENVRNRASLKLVTSFPWEEEKKDGCMSAKRKLLRRLANPMVENVTIFDENMICIHSHKTEVLLNKPICRYGNFRYFEDTYVCFPL